MEHIHHPSAVVLTIIFLNYLIYAANVFRLARVGHINSKRAFVFGWLSSVFVLCGICHITGLLPHDFWLYREGLYWVLAGFSCVLNFSNQAHVMAQMIGEQQGPK